MTTTNNQLKSIIERIVRLEEDKKAIADDIKDVYAEAKGNGFDIAALRVLVKEQMEDAAKRSKRETLESILEAYRAALGPLADSPLGQAALERAG